MSYISRRLAPGEIIVRRGEFHWIQKTWPWLALLLLGILIIGVVIWAVALFRMATTRWAVTNRRVILKRGFFVVHVDELTLGAVEGAHVDQSIVGRLFGYGKLRLSGRGDTELVFPTMAHPNHFRSAIEGARIKSEEPHTVVVDEVREARGEDDPDARRRPLPAARRAAGPAR